MISAQAKIITDKLLKITKIKTHHKILTTRNINTYTDTIVLSYNNLNYHVTRAKQTYSEYYGYCSEEMRTCDQNWIYVGIALALCKCPYFSNIREYVLKSYQITTENIVKVSINIKASIDKIIKFFEKLKYSSSTGK